MKKTSTRLAALGGLVILGACALALAQHDSRNREREPRPIAAFAGEQAEPIPADPAWGNPLDFEQRFRFNNDGQEAYTQTQDEAENPLRAPLGEQAGADLESPAELDSGPTARGLPGIAALPELPPAGPQSDSPTRSALATAFPSDPVVGASAKLSDTSDQSTGSLSDSEPQGSAERIPGRLTDGPIKPPAWLNNARLPSTNPQAPEGGQQPLAEEQSLPGTSASQADEGPATALPGFPRQDVSSRAEIPALPAGPASGGPGPASQRGNPNQDLSDTQRAAMPATRMLGTPVPVEPKSESGAASGAPPALPGSSGSSGSAASQNNPTPPGRLPNVPSLGNGPATNSPLPSSYGPSVPVQPMPSGNATPPSSAGLGGVPGNLMTLVSNQPGGRHLDGSQNPILMIEKRAPDEVQVGKPATFVITVQNAGNSPAYGVTVLDRVPQGVRFAESIPAIRPGADGLLEWKIGELAAGATTTISLKLIPEVEGEIGSVATVHFAAQASVRTVATQPKLELLLESLPDVLIGDNHQLVVTLRNVGTGMAKAVRLQADIPALLRHESGDAELEAPLGNLRPNESKRIPLSVAAVQPGQGVFAIRAVNDDGIMSERSVDVEVKSPQLVAAIEGPKLRYLERQATYRIAVQNTGTAAATNVDFVVHLPAGLKFNSASTAGYYDPSTHAVTWGLQELNAGQTAPLEVTVLPVELGTQLISFGAKADLGVTAEAKQQVTVEGHAELMFTIGQDNGTIEVGASSTYSVQVTNVGNKPDRNVQLAVELPPGTKLLRVDAPVEYQAAERQIVFAPMPEMRKRDQYTFSFQVQHNQPGTQVVRAKLTSGNWPQPVVKEEGTLVYNDQN